MASKADNLEGEKADNGSEKEHARDFPTDGNGDTLMECPDNSRGSDNKLLHHNWSQTWSSVTIQLDVGRVLNDEDFITKDFLDHRADILLTDGRYWSCLFVHPIDADKSRLFWRSNALIIVLMKKTANVEWLDLQAIQAQPTTESTPAGAEGGVAAEVTRDQEESPEDQTKKEEPVKVIEHAKHSWFETNDLMTLHVFVKEINKDSLRVIYQDKFVTIKFQSNDGKFLEINKVQDPETSFLWRISLKGEIEPSQCKHRLMSTKVEVFLKKRLPIRWSALEAPTQTGQSSPAHNIWHPVATSAPKAPAPPPPPCVKPVSFTVGSKPLVSSSQSLASSLKNRSRALFGRGSSSESDDESQSNGDTRQLTNANSQKPTCKVSPLNKSSNSKVITSPGMTGLDNLGNTCFMNSTLQVLANTKGFREFFLDSVFQKDINTDNPLGCGGQLAVSFAVLLKVLWAGTQYSYAPAKLKNLVASKNSQFSGFAQHDAQEFLAFLLDGLHEDLNRIKHKPYIENKDSDGRSDMEVADEQWDLYRQRNDSAIVDLFQGQYKSTVICPKCSKVSITFDPYMYLSVPIPKQKVMIPVYFVSKDLHTKPVKYVLGLSKDARGADLTKAVSQRTGIPAKDLRAFEVYKCRFHRFFERTSDLAGLTSNDLVFVFEVLSEELAGEPVVELNVIQRVTCPVAHPTRCAYCQRECDVDTRLKRCTKCLRVGYCNQGCQRDHWQVHRTRCRDSPEPVGHPFMVSLPRSKLSYSRLAQAMQSFAIHSVDVFQPPVKDSLSSVSSDLSLSESMEAGSDQDTSSLSNDTFLDNANGNTGSAKSCTVTRTDKEDTWVDNGVAMDTKYEKCEDMLDQLVDTCLQDSSDLGTKSNKNLDNQFLKNDNEVNYDKSAEIREKTSAQTRVVLGYPQVEPVVALNFWMKPVNHQGIGLPAPKGTRLTDQGDSPLDLTSGQYLAMDWKNNERSKQYVMVQTKELDYVEDSQAGSSGRSESKEISLHHCLQLFTEPEVLSPEEAWYCPRCKKHVEASKQMAIWRLPHTLIIHLKRFSFRNFIWRDKIDRFIDFPVSGLDMSEFFVGVNQLEDPPPVYDLYGVINHHGGILGGHYTSYARLPSEIDSKKNDLGWRLFDDSRVRYANPNNIVSTAGYVLFYRRRCATPSLCTNPLPTGKSKVNQDKLKMECSSDESNDELDFGDSSNSPQEVPGVTRHTVSPESDEMAGGDVGRPLNNLTTAPSDEGCHVYTGPSYTDMESVD